MDNYTFNQIGNGNMQIVNAENAKLAEDLKRSRAWADELAHLMAGAIETREKAKDALRKQIRHTTRARKQRDALKDEIVAMREELAALKSQNHPVDPTAMVAPVVAIPTTGNRVLTLDEVLALPEGARVWVELSRKSYFNSEVHTFSTAENRSIAEIKEPRLTDMSGGWFPINADWVNDEYRVWSLPQEPTQAEKDANPWGKGEAE